MGGAAGRFKAGEESVKGPEGILPVIATGGFYDLSHAPGVIGYKVALDFVSMSLSYPSHIHLEVLLCCS